MKIRAIVAIIFALTLIAASEQAKPLKEGNLFESTELTISPNYGSNYKEYVYIIKKINPDYKRPQEVRLIGTSEDPRQEVYNKSETWDGKEPLIIKVTKNDMKGTPFLGKITNKLMIGSTFQRFPGHEIGVYYKPNDYTCKNNKFVEKVEVLAVTKCTIYLVPADNGEPVGQDVYDKTNRTPQNLTLEDPSPSSCPCVLCYNFSYAWRT